MTACMASGEEFSPFTCAWLVLRGQRRFIDIFCVKQQPIPTQPATTFFGALSVGWALISDIDFESEKWRCCGGFRFTWTALGRLLCLRKYEASVSWVVADGQPLLYHSNMPRCQPTQQGTPCPACTSRHSQQYQELSRFVESPLWLEGAESDLFQMSKSNGLEKWEVCHDSLSMVWAMNVSHAATDMYVAPMAHLNDGCLDLNLVRGGSTCSLIPVFLGFEDGSHTSNNSLEYIKVKGLRLYPDPANCRESSLSVDGERLPGVATEVRVFSGIIQLLSS